MSRGIAILSLGNPIYGKFAINLACSLKHVEDCKIALIHTTSAIIDLSDEHECLFDQKILFDDNEVFINGKHQYQFAKFLLPKYSPFDETIFLDADTLWNSHKLLNGIFEYCQHNDVFMQIGGSSERGTGYTFWGNVTDILHYYDLKIIPCTYGGFIYFKKTPKAYEFFETAREIYLDENTPSNVEWAGGIADEYCFNISLALNYYNENWELDYLPIYFSPQCGVKYTTPIENDYAGMALSGNIVGGSLKTAYRMGVRRYSDLTKIKLFEVPNKKDVIRERQVM
jgi:hypothetical protein